MFHAMNALLAPALMERLTLWVNHLLASEPAAQQRLKAHAGRSVQLHLTSWPALLPAAPALRFGITPAGLLEWQGEQTVPDADLQVSLDASNPARLAAGVLAGETPPLEVRGDAALAHDVSWLFENLRWDAEADLARVIDPRVAHELARFGAALAAGLRSAVRGAADLAAQWRPGAP
jgi:ubiquinone biosynthesis protein UbiJ